jgi:hypothetical protein
MSSAANALDGLDAALAMLAAGDADRAQSRRAGCDLHIIRSPALLSAGRTLSRGEP